MSEVTITLKKGLDLIQSILETANKIKVETTSRLSVYGTGDPEAILQQASHKVADGVHDIIQLVSIHYNIKRSLGEANDRLGITDLIRERVKYDALDKRVSAILKSIQEKDPVDSYRLSSASMNISDIDAIRDRIKLSRDRIMNKEISSGEESFSVNVVSDKFRDEIADELFRIKRQKSACIDQIAALNINNKIVISDADAAVLQKHKLA